MEGATTTCSSPEPHQPLASLAAGQSSPFSQQWVTITKQEHIDLTARANYWEAQHARVKAQLEELKQGNLLKEAKIKDLRNRLFGKKSEKNSPLQSEKHGQEDTDALGSLCGSPGKVGTRWYLWVTRSRCMGLTGCPLRAVTAAQGRAETASATGS